MKRILATLAVLTIGATANAQTGGCAAQWSRLNSLLERGDATSAPGIVRMTTDGGCQLSSIALPIDRHVTLKADSLRWGGTELERFASDGVPPTSLVLHLKGIALVPVIGDKTFDYLQSIQARGNKMDLSLSADWDAQTQVISLRNARLSWPNGDFIAYQAEVEGIDLTTKNSFQSSVGRFAMTKAKLTVRSERLFKDYILIPLGTALLEDAEDPEARVQELKTQGRELIDTVPAQLLPSGSKSALKSLISDMPEPRGELTIEQTATPGLGPARALPYLLNSKAFEDVSDFFTLLDGVNIDVTYEKF